MELPTKKFNDALNEGSIEIKSSQLNNDAGFLSATGIKSVQVVDALPETPENDVLYLIKE